MTIDDDLVSNRFNQYGIGGGEEQSLIVNENPVDPMDYIIEESADMIF